MSERAFLTRLGLGAGSLVLAALLWLGFRSADSVALTGSTAADGSGSGASGPSIAGSARSSGPTSTSGSSSNAGSGSSSGSSATAGAASGSKVVDGPVVETRYGPVAVEVTVSNGKVTTVTATQLPSGGRSGSISRYAGPVLASEAVNAQSASIDIVSGATYTSRAYAQSLQAALDQAGV
jgi:uncharacterized protein with FMN-binding domain